MLGPEFRSLKSTWKSGHDVGACNPVYGKTGGRDRQIPGSSKAGQPGLLGRFQAKERPRLKQRKVLEDQQLKLSTDF